MVLAGTAVLHQQVLAGTSTVVPREMAFLSSSLILLPVCLAGLGSNRELPSTWAVRRCVAAGTGVWVRTPRNPNYAIRSDYLPSYNVSRHNWGRCDLGGPTAVPREATQYEWRPHVPLDGCAALPQDPSQLFPLMHELVDGYEGIAPPGEATLELAERFCSVYANKTILFVGDSISGQMFTSFAHMTGVHGSVFVPPQSSKTACYAKAESGAAHEVVLMARTCAKFDLVVNARFSRNEYLWFDPAHNDPGDLNTQRQYLCEWAHWVAKTDVLVATCAKVNTETSSICFHAGPESGHARRSR